MKAQGFLPFLPSLSCLWLTESMWDQYISHSHLIMHIPLFPTVAMRTEIKYNCSPITLSQRQEQTLEFISYFLAKSRRWSKLLRRDGVSLNQRHMFRCFLQVPFWREISVADNFQRHTAKCSKTEKYRVAHILSRLISPCLCQSHVHPCSSCRLLGHPLQQSQKL